MAYVITDTCIKDLLCVEVCPTDCIHPKGDEPNSEVQPSVTSIWRGALIAAPASPGLSASTPALVRFSSPCHAKVTFEGFPGRPAFHYSERAIYIAPEL